MLRMAWWKSVAGCNALITLIAIPLEHKQNYLGSIVLLFGDRPREALDCYLKSLPVKPGGIVLNRVKLNINE